MGGAALTTPFGKVWISNVLWQNITSDVLSLPGPRRARRGACGSPRSEPSRLRELQGGKRTRWISQTTALLKRHWTAILSPQVGFLRYWFTIDNYGPCGSAEIVLNGSKIWPVKVSAVEKRFNACLLNFTTPVYDRRHWNIDFTLERLEEKVSFFASLYNKYS